MYKITPIDDNSGMYKQGELPPTISKDDIERVLGFPPNIDDDAEKVEFSWAFEIDGQRFGIWDYRGWRWSTYGDSEVLAELFGDGL